MSPFRRKKPKIIHVRICTFDSELEFPLEQRATGQELFELVCRTIGLRETWYFGLQYTDIKGDVVWLEMDKKVKDQKINIINGGCSFNFFAKFFPENVSEELIQEITQHLFFLQVKQSILSMDIYCPPEASVLLASYAVHVQFGPYDYENYKPGMLAEVAHELLPKRVIDQYQMTPQMWEDRIRMWYEDHEPMTRDEVEMEYLKIAQDLDMYGVNYFSICNKKNSDLWLGVTAMGLNIYEKSNKLTPKTTFTWSEIRNVSFDGKKFKIRPGDLKAPNFEFNSQNSRINSMILDLCIGNHNLFLKRRKQDSMEIQQMKAQAKEEKQRRQIERSKFMREKKLRETVEKEKSLLERRLQSLQDEMRSASDALRRSEEAKEIYLEKSRVNEEHIQLTERKANTFKDEMDHLKKEKGELEKKIRDAEFYVQHLTEEKDKRASEADRLKKELYQARMAEREATAKLLNFLSRSVAQQCSMESVLLPTQQSKSSSPSPQQRQISSSTTTLTTNQSISPSLLSSELPSTTSDNISVNANKLILDSAADLLLVQSNQINDYFISQNDMEQITNEIERNRVEYLEKSKLVQNQLRTLRSEIELLKIEDQQCPLDIISEQNLRSGETKYSTLKKLKSGSTKARVAFFEEL